MKKKKTEILMNKPVSLGLSILGCKVLMHGFSYDHVKRKYSEKKIVLYGYRQFHCIHKNRRYL